MTINNPAYKTWLDSTANPFESIMVLEKSDVSEVDLSDISDALEEYVRLFKAEIASPAEILTLSRAYPDEEKYSLAVIDKELDQKEPVVVGGPASVEVVDREGHLITVDAMKRAFDRFMANFRTRNAMVLHSDVQVGWALPAYIAKSGKIYKSGVTGDHLFFITELRDDTKISKRVLEQISDGKMKSYSIAGSATSVEAMQKASGMVMQVNDMELAEVTICEQGVNQKAKFELMKSDAERPTSSCVDGSCLIKSQEHKHSETELFMDENGIIDTVGSFTNWVQKEANNDPEDQPQKVVNKEDTSNQGLIEDMQKGHLQGCGCETCGSASSGEDKHADDSSRDATDRHGRPTLGHTGHGHAVAILISRMHRKARGFGEDKFLSPYHNPKASVYSKSPTSAQKKIKDQRVWRESERTRAEKAGEAGKLLPSRNEERARAGLFAGQRRGGARYVGDREARVPKKGWGGGVETGPSPQNTKEAKAAAATDLRTTAKKNMQNMQKAIYEYINKAYKVPSREELKAGADKRKEKALADAKERYGEDFTPADTSQRRKYTPKTAPVAADRKTAAQDAWRKANPGQPDPESFSSMVKALLKFVSMSPPKPKGGNTATPEVPKQPEGSTNGTGNTKPQEVKPDPEPEGEVQPKPKDTSQPWANTGGKGGGLIGNLVRSAQDIAGVRHGTPKEAMQNMEKQELEWATPQVETPLHKFLDYNNERGS